jgi:flagellar hook-length control protein FliK
MNDLNFAGLIAARQAATQARGTPASERAMDPRDAASAFDAVMARASRGEAARGAERPRTERSPDAPPAQRVAAPRDGQPKAAAAQPAANETREPARDTMAERTPAEAGDAATSEAATAAAADATAASAAAAAASATMLPMTPAAVQAALDAALAHPATGETRRATAAPAAATPPQDTALDLESLSTVIRSDDPLADAVQTPRGLARALAPEESVAPRAAKAPATAAVQAAETPAHAAPFERLVEAAQRDAAAQRDIGIPAAGRRGASSGESAATMRVDGANAATAMFAPAAPATYSAAHGSVSAPVGQSAFAEEFASRVVMFTSQKVHNAQIALTPSELGPISITIEVRGQEAHLSFNAAHATTRAAIEDALPRLRDMLSSNGLQLANAHVGDQAQRDPGRSRRGSDGEARAVGSVGSAGPAGGPHAASAVDAQAMRAQWLRSDRLIDIVV